MPPVVVRVTDVLPPLQEILPGEADAEIAAGCEMVPDAIPVQPFASVTVYEYAPADAVNDPVPV